MLDWYFERVLVACKCAVLVLLAMLCPLRRFFNTLVTQQLLGFLCAVLGVALGVLASANIGQPGAGNPSAAQV